MGSQLGCLTCCRDENKADPKSFENVVSRFRACLTTLPSDSPDPINSRGLLNRYKWTCARIFFSFACVGIWLSSNSLQSAVTPQAPQLPQIALKMRLRTCNFSKTSINLGHLCSRQPSPLAAHRVNHRCQTQIPSCLLQSFGCKVYFSVLTPRNCICARILVHGSTAGVVPTASKEWANLPFNELSLPC